MNKAQLQGFRDEMRKGGARLDILPRVRVDIVAENMKLVDKNSAFFGIFQPDHSSAFVEFDICHSLPVVAGPASTTGNYTCWHPAALSKSHRGLLYKQTNLHHFIRSYNEDEISRDRIIGCVVMTSYPAEPDGGWNIPDTEQAAIPIHACSTIFKQAEGALEMLNDHRTGRQKWSVSIEVSGNSFEEMGIYFPKGKKLIGLLDAPDEVLEEALSKDDYGNICLGKFQGEQLALCYGGVAGACLFRGVGYTPSPAEKTARITAVNLEQGSGFRVQGSGEDQEYELEEKPGGIMAMCASSANVALATAAVESRFKGARLVKVFTEGQARLKDHFWHLEASAAKPVAEIRLSDGKSVLRYVQELTK